MFKWARESNIKRLKIEDAINCIKSHSDRATWVYFISRGGVSISTQKVKGRESARGWGESKRKPTTV